MFNLVIGILDINNYPYHELSMIVLYMLYLDFTFSHPHISMKGLIISLGLLISGYTRRFTRDMWVDMQWTATLGVLTVFLRFGEILPLYISGILMTWWLIVTTSLGTELFQSYFSSVVVLLLWWLVLALLVHDSKLDQMLFQYIIPAGTYTATWLIWRLMFLSAFLSMWMSNTAAAALIIPLIYKLCKDQGWVEHNISFVRRLVIAVAYAATIGGRGTIIGSPTNPLAVASVQDIGLNVNFLEWMMYGLPVVLILLFLAVVVVTVLFPSKWRETLDISYTHNIQNINKQQKYVLIIIVLTVLGWLTTPRTGLSSSVIALLPLILWASFGVFAWNDISKIDWPTLLLIGSGIVLWTALTQVGRVDIFSTSIETQVSWMSVFLTLLIVWAAWVGLTMFVSNTASAAVMLPFLLPLSPSLWLDPVMLAMFISIAVSLDFTAPMGTPPNAIAYGTGVISVTDMAKAWLILTAISLIVLSGVASLVW